MTDLKAKVAYLQGLSTGLDLDANSKEHKLFNGIIEVLDEFADSVVELEEEQEQLEDYLETIDEDLYHLEGEIYEDDDLDDFIEVRCSKCGETVYFDSHIPEDEDVVEVICPTCDEVVFVNDEGFQSEDKPETLDGQVAESKPNTRHDDI